MLEKGVWGVFNKCEGMSKKKFSVKSENDAKKKINGHQHSLLDHNNENVPQNPSNSHQRLLTCLDELNSRLNLCGGQC